MGFVYTRHRKDIVVVGGGFGGAFVSKSLEDRFKITLIDSKDYFEFTPSVLRTIVEPNHVSSIQIRHRSYLNLEKSAIIRSRVEQINESHIITASGKEVAYDYLVLCSGTTYNMPFKEANVILANRGETLSACYTQLSSMQTVLVIGGGIVGVELAAEIAEKFKDLEVILAHSGDHLMSGRAPVHKKAYHYAEKQLHNLGVKILLNERVVSFAPVGEKTFVTENGTQILADMAFLSTGIIPNSQFLENGVLSSELDKRGFVIVNKYMQVDSFPNIFVAGDVASIEEEKLAQNAEKHARVVVANILNNEKGVDRTKWATYTSKPRMMLISLGKYDGIFVFKNITLTGFIPGVMKEFVEWKVMTAYKNRSSNNIFGF